MKNMNKTTRLFLFSAALLFFTQPFFAGTAQTQTIKFKNAQKLFSSEGSSVCPAPLSSSSSDDSSSSLLGDLISAFFILGAYTSYMTAYDSYPGAHYGNYINWTPDGFSNAKRSRMTLSTQAVWLNDYEFGNESSLDAVLIWGLGLDAANLVFHDGTGNVRVSGQYYYLQSNPLSLAITLGWSRWYGQKKETDRNLFNLGLKYTSFLLNPVIIDAQTSWDFLTDNRSVFHWKIQLGCMVKGRTELTAAWKGIASDTKYEGTIISRGASAGIRLWY